MNRLVQALALATAIALGFWLFRTLFPNDVDAIRKRLTEMAADASFDSSEAPLTKMSKAGKLAGYFTVDAEINIKPWGYREVSVNGRTEIRQAAVGARSTVDSLKISVDRADVTVSDDRDSAQVLLSLTAVSSRQSEPWKEGIQIQMRRIDGDWLISRVANREVIRQ